VDQEGYVPLRVLKKYADHIRPDLCREGRREKQLKNQKNERGEADQNPTLVQFDVTKRGREKILSPISRGVVGRREFGKRF